MSKKNSGPAYPCGIHYGISIRDYFAAKAMQGIAGSVEHMKELGVRATENCIDPMVLLATGAYAMADAMIAERAK